MCKKNAAHEIADYFIWLSHETGSFISNLKLQKLVYYAQAWHLALFEKPIFEEDFEAWVHGPVIPELYRKYRVFSFKPITVKVEKPMLSKKTNEYLDEFCKSYFGIDAFELELMTHKDSPWIEARKGLKPEQNGDRVISKDSMRDYYGKKLKAQKSR